jgi:hypothetical protein
LQDKIVYLPKAKKNKKQKNIIVYLPRAKKQNKKI